MSNVDEVKARLDIVDVVGGYGIPLQKAGRYFKAACPFHSEKTPSFVVYPERQSWHCFGACGTGGDVISFVSRKENLDFAATLGLLAERAGVELSDRPEQRQRLKTLHDANAAAALFYQGLLQGSAAARAYVEERGLEPETLRDFQVGFAPTGWENLKDHLLKKGFGEEQLIEAGLLVEGDRGGYDRFRERLMIPIKDDRGRVVGFGGRVLPISSKEAADPGPKYVNTPQTPIFDKGGLLYGLDRAKVAVRAEATSVIVEGYMDVLTAHQHGFKNVAASMGTALTGRQAGLLKRLSDTVILAMDSDEAGSAATLRGIQVVAASAGTGRGSKTPLNIRVLALPQGKDPDELIRSAPEIWPQAIEASRPVVDHMLAAIGEGLDLAQPLDRSKLVSEVLPVIGEETDPVLQAHYLQRLSRLARTPEETLRRQLPHRARPARERAAAAVTRTDAPGPSSNPIRSAREEFCLALLFRLPELSELASELSPDLFGLSENRELLRLWQLEQLPPPETTEEGRWLAEHYQAVLETRIAVNETSQAAKAFLDCVARLRTARMRFVKEASAMALAEGEAGVSPGQVAAIARERLTAGPSKEAEMDHQAGTLASTLLEDMEAGLRFHRRASQTPDTEDPAAPDTNETEQ